MDRASRVFSEPRLVARGLNRVYHRRGGLRTYNTDGVDVFGEDWDTLVLLDACRYDMFQQVNAIEGELSSRESRGSATKEWLAANVDGRDLHDTVYVTANPQLERNRRSWDVNFHETVNVWLETGWDERTGTVLAETMTEAAIRAHEEFPHKRLLVHYMQPHYPFVPAETDFDKGHLDSIESPDDAAGGKNVWELMFTGDLEISLDELWAVYVENLEYVLKHVKDLLAAMPGKTVITADHGNYVGERASPIPIREFGHPRGLYDSPVVCVPWLVCPHESRREVVAGSAAPDRSPVEHETVERRLRDLGYTCPVSSI